MPVLQVSNNPADAKKAMQKAVPSMFTSFSVNTARGDLHFNGPQAAAVASFVSKMLSTRVRVIEGPEVCRPINAYGGLYLRLQYTNGAPEEVIHAQAKAAAAQHGGFNVEGDCTVGMPEHRGLDTYTSRSGFTMLNAEMSTTANPARYLGQLMPLGDIRYPWVVTRATCQPHSPQYLGRLPASQTEITEYRRICGLDPTDINVLGIDV